MTSFRGDPLPAETGWLVVLGWCLGLCDAALRAYWECET